MRVIFRTDASRQIGSGHVLRCVTLAEALHEIGIQSHFICASHEGNLIHWLAQEKKCAVSALPEKVFNQPAACAEQIENLGQPPDWLVVDHYGLDAEWEKALQPHTKRLMVIDDLADRPHHCDLLLDQNLNPNPTRYDTLVPAPCNKLLGPQYALLREEFRQARLHKTSPHRGQLNQLLVFFGGSDPGNETGKVLSALNQLKIPNLTVDVVIGSLNPHRNTLITTYQAMPGVRFHHDIHYMARLMREADLMVGAGGTTSWERCCVGLPALVITIADNQVALTHHLAQAGIVFHLGASSQVSATDIGNALQALRTNPHKLSEAAMLGSSLVDGQGVKRVIEAMGF